MDVNEQLKFASALQSVRLKFKSGNSVPIERAWVTRAEWDALEAGLAAYDSSRREQQAQAVDVEKVRQVISLMQKASLHRASTYPFEAGCYQAWIDALTDALTTQQAASVCPSCYPDGVYATDGNGPYDCYTCGKKAPSAEPTTPAPTEPRRFIDNGDGTITDTTTGLMWSKAAICGGGGMCWDSADKACRGLLLAGHSDWRLPTRAELLSLVDDTRHDPAIDTEAFPDTDSDWYWTATSSALASSCAWVVNFEYGPAYSIHRDEYAFVRAVRSAPATPPPSVLDGWVLVPIDPTPQMFAACDTIIQGYGAKLVYQRMLSAAPKVTP